MKIKQLIIILVTFLVITSLNVYGNELTCMLFPESCSEGEHNQTISFFISKNTPSWKQVSPSETLYAVPVNRYDFNTQFEIKSTQDLSFVNTIYIKDKAGRNVEVTKNKDGKFLYTPTDGYLQINPIYVFQNDTTVQYIDGDLEVNATLRKWNGEEFVISPEEVWIRNATNSTGYKFGANDTVAKNTTLYEYEWISNNPIYMNKDYYYLRKSQDVGTFFTSKYLYDYIDTSDICTDDANCTFNLTNVYIGNCSGVDAGCNFSYASLKVEFYAFYNLTGKNIIEIDPAYDEILNTDDTFIDWQTTDNRTGVEAHDGLSLDAPIFYLNFNKAPEGTYVQDNSLYNIEGTTNSFDGDEFTSSCTGRTFPDDGCYDLDGSNDWIGYTDNDVDVKGSVTLSVWFTYSANSDIMFYNANTGATNSDFLVIGSYSGTLLVCADNANAGCKQTSALSTGQWYHLVVVKDVGNVTNLYIDGSDDTNSAAAAWSAGNADFRIGRSSPSGNYWDGKLDELLVFDKALTSTEVSCLYDGTGGDCDGGNNNTDYWGKYAGDGHFTSLVWYNETLSEWNVTMSFADSNYSGVKNCSNTSISCGGGINRNYSKLLSYFDLDTGGSNANPYNDDFAGFVGTPTGTNNATGLSSGAMRFDGSDDFISVPDNSVFVDKNKTISFWFNSDDVSQTENLLYIVNTGFNNVDGFTAFTYTGELIVCGKGVAANCRQSSTLTSDTWYHAVAVKNQSDIVALYINGVEDTNAAAAYLGIANVDHRIGRHSPTGFHFDGMLDEVLIYNASFTSSEVLELYKTGLSQHANANITLETRVATAYNTSDANLVSLWGLNGSATDWKGSNHGTVSGATYGDEYGVVGGGYNFDGVDDAIQIPDDNSLKPTGAFTYSAWFKTGSSATQVIVDKYSGSTIIGDTSRRGASINVHLSKAQFTVRKVPSAATTITGSTNPIDNKWHHLVGVYDGTNINLYFDGILENTTTSTNYEPSTEPLMIGNRSDTGFPFHGSIDEVRIYNRSLSADEVKNLYELGSYHIEWNDWNETGLVLDGVPKQANGTGNFYQFRAKLDTDDTDVSPYILNYSVSYINVSIEEGAPPGDTTPPTVTIVFPADNSNHTTTSLDLNYTATDETALNLCWHNTTGSNSTPVSPANFTGQTANQGNNSWWVWCNDTSNNIGHNNTNFLVDSIPPSINYVSPTPSDGDSFSQSYVEVNVTATDVRLDSIVIYFWNASFYLLNTTITTSSPNFANYTSLEDGDYYFNATANDTFGNLAVAELNGVTLFGVSVDTIPPEINITYPVNGTTFTSNISIDLNYTATDYSNISMCWNNISGVNSTPISPVNFTGNYADEGDNAWFVWCNDTAGNINYNSTIFALDFPPTASIDLPNTDWQDLVFPFEMSCTDVVGTDTLWYGWEGTNYTYTASVDLSASAGYYTIYAWCNDTYGTINSTEYSFNIVGTTNVTTTFSIPLSQVITIYEIFNTTSNILYNISMTLIDGKTCNVLKGVCV